MRAAVNLKPGTIELANHAASYRVAVKPDDGVRIIRGDADKRCALRAIASELIVSSRWDRISTSAVHLSGGNV